MSAETLAETLHHNTLPSGFKIHWYEIDSILGEGGFGITYLAHDTNLNHRVAIKEYFPRNFAGRSQGGTIHTHDTNSSKFFNWGLKRFLSEAQTLAQLRHQNIVQVYSVFEANRTAYMVMEHLKGQSLKTTIDHPGSIPESDLLNIIYPILDGLKAIHKAGFIHRDIKPSNISFRENGEPVLLDFGSARQSLIEKTQMLTTLISPGFAPFEQYYNSDKTAKQGPWTDIYSLGATVYMAIAETPPTDVLTRVSAVLHGKDDPIITATEIGEGKYSPQFLSAIDSAIGLNPEDRPQSVDEFLKLLPSLEKTPAPKVKICLDKYSSTPVCSNDNSSSGHNRSKRVSDGEVTKTIILDPSSSAIVETQQFVGPPAPQQRQKNTGFIVAIVLSVAVILAIVFQLKNDKPIEKHWEPIAADLGGSQIKQIQLSQLLATAKRDLDTLPPVPEQIDSAVTHYKAALNLAPENQEALDGLKIAGYKYAKIVENAIVNGQLRIAEQYLKSAEAIVPNTNVLKLVRSDLKKAKKSLEAKKVLEKQRVLQESEKNLQAKIEQDLILGLLSSAQKDLAALRLSIPPGNNAFERFTTVLQLDPHNTAALNGLEKIVDRYLHLAETEISRKAFAKANRYLTRAEKIGVDEEKINNARKRLVKARKITNTRSMELEKEKRIQRASTRVKKGATPDRSSSLSPITNLAQFGKSLESETDTKNESKGSYQQMRSNIDALDHSESRKRIEQVKVQDNRNNESRGKSTNPLNAPENSTQTPVGKKSVAPHSIKLTESDIFGKWCGENFSLEFAKNNWKFRLENGNKTTYPIRQYIFTPNTISVLWHDELQNRIIAEFGNAVTGPGKRMVLLRGKLDSNDKWLRELLLIYNRKFERCG